MPRILRSLLVLGRVSNLPTVWSNCVAGWVIGGGQPAFSAPLLTVCVGVSLLYLGGMYLNDACDVDFDTAHRPERPIPSGAINRHAVTLLGCLFLGGGTALLLWSTPRGGVWVCVFLLAALIVLYDIFHKRVAFAPVLMAGCRVLIYPVAAMHRDVFRSPDPGLSVAAGSMGVWIITLSLLARTEAKPGSFRQPALLLLALPLVLGLGAHGFAALLPAALLAAWIARSVWRLRSTGRVGAAVGDLLAGIPLVDLVAVSPPLGLAWLPYLACMLLALILRRSIPPT